MLHERLSPEVNNIIALTPASTYSALPDGSKQALRSYANNLNPDDLIDTRQCLKDLLALTGKERFRPPERRRVASYLLRRIDDELVKWVNSGAPDNVHERYDAYRRRVEVNKSTIRNYEGPFKTRADAVIFFTGLDDDIQRAKKQKNDRSREEGSWNKFKSTLSEKWHELQEKYRRVWNNATTKIKLTGAVVSLGCVVACEPISSAVNMARREFEEIVVKAGSLVSFNRAEAGAKLPPERVFRVYLPGMLSGEEGAPVEASFKVSGVNNTIEDKLSEGNYINLVDCTENPDDPDEITVTLEYSTNGYYLQVLGVAGKEDIGPDGGRDYMVINLGSRDVPLPTGKGTVAFSIGSESIEQAAFTVKLKDPDNPNHQLPNQIVTLPRFRQE